MGVFYLCVKDGILYKYSNFIWECHNGVIPENSKIENVDGNQKNNELTNLRLVPLEVSNDERDQEKVSYDKEIEINEHYELKKYMYLQAIKSYISKIHMNLDSKYL